MGRDSKKKKGGSGKKGKARVSPKDHSRFEDDPELIDELTALHGIFQEDFKLISSTREPQFSITLRPFLTDTSSTHNKISAHLLVRCLPGYPFKCPKLQIVPGEGLSKDNADRLLSLLIDQANHNARQGRVMIFNLAEAAQEFLTEVASVEQSLESASSSAPDNLNQSLRRDVDVTCDQLNTVGKYVVYGLIDLFGGPDGDDGSWDGHIGLDNLHEDLGKTSSTRPSEIIHGDKIVERRGDFSQSRAFDASRIGNMINCAHQSTTHFDKNQRTSLPPAVVRLDVLEEDSEEDSISISSKASVSDLELETVTEVHNSLLPVDSTVKNSAIKQSGNSDSSASEDDTSDSYILVTHNQTPEAMEKNLLMVHLLRLVCSSKGLVPHELPEIATELYNLGILSDWASDLATKPQIVFERTFRHVFEKHMLCSPVSQFWKASTYPSADNSLSSATSRYLNDFEEICSLGHGGFGHVALCRNKLDGRQYAVKRIRLKDKSPSVNERILREVATLSRLQHQHVVRYYQAWFETGIGSYLGEITRGSMTIGCSSSSFQITDSTNVMEPIDKLESTYLYIQMEYCPRTLRQVFDSYNGLFDKESTWHMFRQIVEGLAHIHGQGIIHRDLTPSNIFFDTRNDIKIGDFGLAKFLKLEQADLDPLFPSEKNGLSIEGTGQMGTYFYTAPEIEQGWPQINEKVDMYSLGVVFFELWHPFSTAMERNVILSDLKHKGTPPTDWVAKYPEQFSLLQRLMSPSPSDRPSAVEILRDALPPRMEDEWLNDILRTIQTAEDTYVYDRVLSTIFDDMRLLAKAHRHHGERGSLRSDSSYFIQNTELELQDHIIDVVKDLFKRHGAKRVEVLPLCVLDEPQEHNWKPVRLLTSGGDMLELCHELRMPFVHWIVENQKTSFKRYEISWVYRRAVGPSAPNRYLQGDFDIIGGGPALPESEIIKIAMDVIAKFFHSDACDIHLNHAKIFYAIWSWIGIKGENIRNVAKLISMMVSSCPQSSRRKATWSLVRRQLLQGLHLAETVLDRLHIVDLRFCGPADEVLPRLRGALPPDKPTHDALEELSTLLSYLREWKIQKHVYIDALMPPPESYHRKLFFQIYWCKENTHGSTSKEILFAVGGRYDQLIHRMWGHEYKSSPPGAVGVSIALEKILHHGSIERTETCSKVLVCSRGGGGLLEERMELVSELWQANIKADFVPTPDPSLTEQYEYAYEHDIKWLVILTETGLSQTGNVKVRHLEHKKDMEIKKEILIKFLTEATSAQSWRITMLKDWN
ncbi:eIF-2-alpha kinase GCN2 isoform X1 [Amborella trichopoda]|uniref:eIF-2-alpha kinase GCN2 isoform X1 n=1 Tax=Amborella trichopoda TaxID=13333 RepID=UPI0005D35738|nr:eIF-2-alpha kinase GCN2 isoform X1 [Amborella trichopoda]XP_020527602.1 eIF-2-alpha kinase GCN2 isoform X1 [Amborella trichopoda]XP_020527603.1 eIF-2-alpha kinase GCN2 isoform X1 [Amborella trichopoda]XP_020527604.1 eIF-2-alpha kinase GCN2 isoform X1 [Amborella trichopoda]XP_020527605.1 eIF-2-alpha kinase GCN2 isoform X1 [Amborella trichopoda]|eukprot:XP_006852117.2 eIF-2-alpha kinase GCN2 isoform X1 [Amborella trichopoda]